MSLMIFLLEEKEKIQETPILSHLHSAANLPTSYMTLLNFQ